MKRAWLWFIAILVVIAGLVLLAWGPVLVTSPGEALSEVQRRTILEGSGHTYGDVIQAYEAAVGARGKWNVELNETYQSFFDGDEHGYRWIVTYDASGIDHIPELEFYVKRFTGDVSLREPNWSFLPDDLMQEYLSTKKE